MTDKDFVLSINPTCRCVFFGNYYKIIKDFRLLSWLDKSESGAWSSARYIAEREFLNQISK